MRGRVGHGLALIVVTALLLAGVVAPATAAVQAPRPVVVGNILVDEVTGEQWIPRGVNFPSFEYACAQGWGYSRSQATAATAQAIAAWAANVVRVPLNQDCWLGTNGAPAGAGRTAAGYRDAVASFVSVLNAAGLAVILDLHSWKTDTTANIVGQRAMPDAASLDFWSTVAARFAGNPSVIFDAFNEPYSRWNDATGSWAFELTWQCWKSGGCQAPIEDDYTSPLSGATYTATGMDAIVAAIRGAGATQPIILNGLDYSNDLRQWLAFRPADGQLIAGFHNYLGQRCHTVACWNAEIAPVAAVVPVVTGEFGETTGTSTFIESYMAWADARGVGYLPWAWWVLSGSPTELALLANDDGTPLAPLGTAFRAHLLALVDDPCPDRTVPRVSAEVVSGDFVLPPGPVCLAGGAAPPVEAVPDAGAASEPEVVVLPDVAEAVVPMRWRGEWGRADARGFARFAG